MSTAGRYGRQPLMAAGDDPRLSLTPEQHAAIGDLVIWASEALPILRRHGVDYPLMGDLVRDLGHELGPWYT
jgi:hypothetical protein